MARVACAASVMLLMKMIAILCTLKVLKENLLLTSISAQPLSGNISGAWATCVAQFLPFPACFSSELLNPFIKANLPGA